MAIMAINLIPPPFCLYIPLIMVPSIALNLVRLASRRTLPTLHHSLIPSLSTLPLTSNPLYSLRTFTTKPTESSNKPLSGSDEAPDGAMEPIMPDPVEGEVVTSERVSGRIIVGRKVDGQR